MKQRNTDIAVARKSLRDEG